MDEIYQALQNMKAGTAPGYDHVHPKFLKNLGPRAVTLILQDYYYERNTRNLEKDEGNCDRETRKGPKTGGKLPSNISA